MAVERKLIDEKKKRLLMAEYLERETARAGFGGVDIQRTPLGLRIKLVAERPGFVIGRRGSTIQRITQELRERFDLENPQIEVEEARDPNLNPRIMAQKLAEALERGWHFRRAGHSTVRRIMDGGAKGCIVTLTGKLTGARGRMEKFQAGHIKYCGEPAELYMWKGYAVAKKKLGIIGVKVAIMDPKAKLPDDITVVEPGQVPADVRQVSVVSDAAADAALAEVKAGLSATSSEPVEVKPHKPGGLKLTDIPGVGKAKADALEKAGYSFESIVSASIDELSDIEGLGPKLAQKIKEGAEKVLRERGGGA